MSALDGFVEQRVLHCRGPKTKWVVTQRALVGTVRGWEEKADLAHSALYSLHGFYLPFDFYVISPCIRSQLFKAEGLAS